MAKLAKLSLSLLLGTARNSSQLWSPRCAGGESRVCYTHSAESPFPFGTVIAARARKRGSFSLSLTQSQFDTKALGGEIHACCAQQNNDEKKPKKKKRTFFLFTSSFI